MTQAPQPSGEEELGFELPAPAQSSWLKILIVVVVVVGGVFAIGYMNHQKARGGTPISAMETGPLRVEVFSAKELSSDHALALPGVVRPLEEAKIYSRSQGYVRKWLVDIGDKVKEGQLLAEIDTPELDAQLAQARAQLAAARATVKQASAQTSRSPTRRATSRSPIRSSSRSRRSSSNKRRPRATKRQWLQRRATSWRRKPTCGACSSSKGSAR
jgi:multidrug efflux pump subunit AcrA (membrane-fusion protein)